MSREVLITTPENIAIEYELAGIGTRSLAALLDILMQGLIILASVVVFLLVMFLMSLTKFVGATTFLREVSGFVVGRMETVPPFSAGTSPAL